jgi:aryl-alcohol dehydrogenase-like predicted oxidoreductase
MLYTALPGLDRLVSRCVLGTSGVRDESKFGLLDRFVEAGGTFLDTARVYGGGASERAVGEWIRRTAPDGLAILGKGAHPPACTPDAVAADLAVSLETLGVPAIDLYLLHRDDPQVPVGEFVDALEAERAAGRIRAYGGSNWTLPRLIEANRYAREHGAAGMTALSNHFSLAEPAEALYPGCEATPADLRRHLADTGIALLPWSSQGRGFFADVPRESLDPNVWRCWDTGENRARRDRAAVLGEELGVATVNVALAYVLAQPFPTLPIIGPQTEEQLALALRGVEVEITPDRLAWLESGVGAVAGRYPAI